MRLKTVQYLIRLAAALACCLNVSTEAQIPRFYTCNSSLLASARTAFPGYGIDGLNLIRMNNGGDMIGYLHGSTMPPSPRTGADRACAYVGGQWYDLQLRAYGYLAVHDLNSVGDVVGFYERVPGYDNLGYNLFLWRGGPIFDLPNPVEPWRTFTAYSAARINNLGQMIATQFDWDESGFRQFRDFAIEPISAGTWAMAPVTSRVISINNLQEVLGDDSSGPWIANSPLAVAMPIVRIVDLPRRPDGGPAHPLLLTDGGNILWDTGALTGRSGTPAAQAPFQVSTQWREPRAGGSDTLLAATYQGMALWRWRSGEIAWAADLQLYNGTSVYGLDPIDINGNGQLLHPGFGVCTPSAPIFLQHPTNVDATIGRSLILTARVAGADSLQWQKNGEPIIGQTNASLRFSIVRPENAGNYSLVASNVTGTTAGEPARLRIAGPRFSPETVAYQPGSAVQLSLPVPTGVRVTVEASSDLKNWEIVTNGVAESSIFSVTDAVAASAPTRFYRGQFSLP